MASVMFFGSIPSTLALNNKVLTGAALEPVQNHIAPNTAKVSMYGKCKQLEKESNKLISEYEQRIVAFNSKLNSSIGQKLERLEFGHIKKRGKQTIIRRASRKQVEEGKERKATLEKFMADFSAGKFEDVVYKGDMTSHVRECRGEQVSIKGPYWHRTYKQDRSKPRNKEAAVCTNVESVFNKVLKVCALRELPVEFIGKSKARNVRGGYKRVKNSTVPYIQLPHMHGIRLQREVHPQCANEFVTRLVKFRKLRDNFNDADIKRGWSGFILPRRVASTYWRKYDEIIVRGRLYGRIEDARTNLPWPDVYRTDHYGSNESKFFEGWQDGFKRLTPDTRDHFCKVMQDNRYCGRLAASIVQIAFPCHKLSCDLCRGRFENLSAEAYSELINKHLDKRVSEVNEAITQYPELKRVVANFRSETVLNENMKAVLEVQKVTQGHKANQMQQIHRINDILLKGNTATPTEFGEASDLLLEITRWFSNHLNLVDKGSLRSFRNKRSSKAIMNPSLMCDNQRDQNGNFVWGERGYHARRVFSNFFDEVIPGNGYKDYIERKGPNGSRKLAIGNLIVSLDLERTRQALQGEAIEKQPLSEACVSKRHNNYVYTCCCVTADDGTPMYSELKNPTKRHLVLGATGDPKLVDLPAANSDKMYVAKEGYCYLNIFLAMLVNVSESEAKAFTKMVRDTIVPMLGTWPTMRDVATACYILTVFHPDTCSAEMPRILVDHASKTMHVIDSFGSLTTGYHVLKAGTASQLVEFASNDMEGEMKWYRVGGDNMPRRERMVTTLIRSIYKPKRLIYLIEEDPYILLMALVSPKLVNSLYNNGALELAMRSWVSRDKELSVLFSMIYSLAQEMSKAELLVEQHRLISECAKKMNDARNLLKEERNVSEKEFWEMLLVTSELVTVDEELLATGFFNYNTRLHTLQEKIYGQRLEEEWRALGWLEKFSLITFARKHRQRSTHVLPQRKTGDLDDKYAISLSWCVGKMKAHLSGIQRYCSSKMHRISQGVKRVTIDKAVYVITRCLKDICYFVNVVIVIHLLMSMITMVHASVKNNQVMKLQLETLQFQKEEAELSNIHGMYIKTHGVTPTKAEFKEYVRQCNEELLKHFNEEETSTVMYQAKTAYEKNLEKVVAMMALLTMLFDTEKSGAVFKALSNIKTVFSTLGDEVRYQSLDEIKSVEDEKKLTVDFELDTSKAAECATMDTQFESWWNKQLEQNRVVPHYRVGGTFIEFTRHTSASVCNTISLSAEQEFVVRGAVGSGKSTGLPFHLMKKGKVLLLEPTRPLAENVCKQLQKEPFHISPTLRMRGLTTFGSSNVSIMTSGFALHYHANNPQRLEEYDFVMIDESHTMDASTMAFYCLLREYEFKGKILKVSATPPGQECEFKTQFDVALKIEETLSFNSFASAQGTGSNADVVQHGDNILVYVASYNDVDQLSKLLIEKGHHVTKVDGRTMKMGKVEIPTRGTQTKKHFIVATNIIENGVTLDIEVVVDFGLKVVAELDSDSRCMRYKKVPINYGERLQRLGRVGRVKPGAALRIGHTETGLTEIPVAIATEAAFLCFAYGLPVITHNVTTSILSKCTSRQARTMMHFELSPFFMVELVRFNGTIHPQIEKLLKGFKLRDCEIELSTLAIPNSGVARWRTIQEYKRMGVQIEGDDDVRVPFAARGIPDKLCSDLWHVIQNHKSDAGFGKLTSACASKVSYTLSTQPHAIPRTIAIIEQLLREEQQKKAHFESLNDTLCSTSFSLAGMVNGIRKRYLRDHSAHNIEVLQNAKAQLLEFNSKAIDPDRVGDLLNYGYLDTVQYQSAEGISNRLKLQGGWNKTLAVKDIVISGMIFVGGCWMLWEYFKSSGDVVTYQGKKRQMQKLKFRDARDRKVGREVYGDDGTVEHYFGAAYTEKGKSKGNNHTKGMGRKTRRFVHMYGFDPTEYSFVRFVDPLTGYAVDENITADISLVQEEIGKVRDELMKTDDELIDYIRQKPGIQAYLMKHGSDSALKVDLTPHVPLAVGRSSASIAGFPEREGELRQTGTPVNVSVKSVPQNTHMDEVSTEGKSIVRGLRDYNPISSVVCQLTNDSDNYVQTLHGIGFGSVIIANSHLFKRNNGTLIVKSHHGEFTVKNTTQLQVHHVKNKDMILIRMPKDFPPFPMKLRFRQPTPEERACLVGSRFQHKHISSEVSDTTIVRPTSPGGYWKHWVTTKDGDCGLPMVALRDGNIIGLHGLTSVKTDLNYFIPFTDDFSTVLANLNTLEWVQHWKHTANKVAWNGLKLKEDMPSKEFNVAKIVSDIQGFVYDEVVEQGHLEKWVEKNLGGNLKAVGHSTSQLVTKHVVKGPCALFQEFCSENEGARKFFEPYLGAYGPSKLNKEAFLKDFLKYSGPIVIGTVNTDNFETATLSVIRLLKRLDFGECLYVTDHEAIFDSLNMKAAVGALYRGKKKEYFEGMSEEEKEQLLKLSCERLFMGKMGVWNGSLKAELRPKEKLVQNKTRTFTAAPIDTLLGGKVCVDDFNNRFYSLNLEGPWSVGMTKFYGGWNKLLRKLPEGWVYCDADGSQFDSSLTPYLINAVVQIREAFMEEWVIGQQMLRNFYTEIVYTPILAPDGTIVKKFKGNNSGQPSTVVDNTLMVILAMYYSMHQEGWTEEQMEENIVFFANGDDLLIAVHPDDQAILDKLHDYFFELGLKYDFSSRHTQKENLWFMSHKGMWKEEMFLPKLEEERIVSILEWDRSNEITHRAEAICASMIEAWGYPELLQHIREFYYWLMQHDCYKDLVKEGKLPYISETALRKLYMDKGAADHELVKYWRALLDLEDDEPDIVSYQGDEKNKASGSTPPPSSSGSMDAGEEQRNRNKNEKEKGVVHHDQTKDKDVGKSSTTVPRLKQISKMRMPLVRGKTALALDHLLEYKPEQVDLSNARATREQFDTWYDAVMKEYEVSEQQMGVILNGLMVWCIENGTSPNLNGNWVMMDGDEQVSFPLKPVIENAKPSFRQIMHHFSDAAEAYIEMRNREKPYMPRYGSQRNLRDKTLARYAFDFYEITSRTPDRAREAHMQMKAAALANVSNKLFGLDGNVATTMEDTERHTATDATPTMHNLMGVRQG